MYMRSDVETSPLTRISEYGQINVARRILQCLHNNSSQGNFSDTWITQRKIIKCRELVKDVIQEKKRKSHDAPKKSYRHKMIFDISRALGSDEVQHCTMCGVRGKHAETNSRHDWLS